MEQPADKRAIEQTFSGGQYDDLGFDARNRQTSVTHKNSSGTALSSESYVYDDAGNLSSKTVDAVTTTYGYDVIDQLTSEATTGYSASYAYDANGNRTSKTLNGSTYTYTYTVDDGDKLTGITNGGTTVKSYTYDAAGRTKTVVTSAGTTTLTYDYESRVTGITYPSALTNSFTYNGLDTRVGKVDSAGTATYRRDGVGVTDPVLNDGSAAYTPGISQRRSGVTTYDLNDRLGTASRQTDTSATTSATRTYDAFGMLLASTGTPKGPFGFAGAHGYQEDSDSGLKLLGHRYYDASTGRFLMKDTAKDGRNWYGYCASNPLTRIDSTGLEWFYDQTTGRMVRKVYAPFTGWMPVDDVGSGYAGTGDGRNNPATDDQPNVGPLPKGAYFMGEPHKSKKTGNYTLDLTPDPQNDMHHQDKFRIHGNNSDHDASTGCIVLPLPARQKIWNSKDHILIVQ